MEEFLTMIGVLFFTFLVLAAAVEAMLEILRGFLEFIPGPNPLRPRISLDDAMKLSGEFANDNELLKAKVAGIKKVAEQTARLGESTKALLDEALAKQGPGEAAAAVSAAVTDIKKKLDEDDRFKIMILRGLSAVIGCILVWWTKINLLDILMAQPDHPQWLAGINSFFRADWLSIILGGLAAAAGSSYWHDQLDRVRKAKEVGQQLTTLAKVR